jgi:hypothetical protein
MRFGGNESEKNERTTYIHTYARVRVARLAQDPEVRGRPPTAVPQFLKNIFQKGVEGGRQIYCTVQ